MVSQIVLAVSQICLCKSVLSVKNIILYFLHSAVFLNFLIRKIIVRDLPEPWVCQIIPHFSFWEREGFESFAIALFTALNCWYLQSIFIFLHLSSVLKTMKLLIISSKFTLFSIHSIRTCWEVIVSLSASVCISEVLIGYESFHSRKCSAFALIVQTLASCLVEAIMNWLK